MRFGINKKYAGISTQLLTLLIFVMLSGCSHQVLTFFFTGVPEPGQERTSEPQMTAAQRKAIHRASSDETGQANTLKEQLRMFYHGPFGTGQCDACHVISGGNLVQAADDSSTGSKNQVTRQLAYQGEDLCQGCHSDKSTAGARERSLWQHGPVANNMCTICHNPHASPRRYMLTKKTDSQLCGQCHNAGELHKSSKQMINRNSECSDCHNPHAGRDPMLLRAAYDERRGFPGAQ
jgi:predicted CXXCH cytochrome family protein